MGSSPQRILQLTEWLLSACKTKSSVWWELDIVGWVGGMNAKCKHGLTWIAIYQDGKADGQWWPHASKVHLSHMAIPKSQSRGKLVRLLSLGSSRSEPPCARNMYHVTYRFHLIDWVVSRPQELLIHWRTSYNYNIIIHTLLYYIILYYIM